MNNNKTDFAALLLCAMVVFLFASNSTHLGVSQYLYLYVPTLFFFIIRVLNHKIKLGAQHIFAAIVFIMIIADLNNIMDYPFSVSGFGFPALVMLMFAATLTPQNKRSIKMLADSFIISAAIFSVLLLILRHEYLDFANSRYTVRLFDWADIDPNYLAQFLCIPAIICFKRMVFPRSSRAMLCYIALCGLIFSALFLTGSRASFIALIIGCLTIAWRDLRRTLPVLIAGGAVFLVIVFLLPQSLYERFFVNSYYDGSNANRLFFWKTSLVAIFEHPLFGYGVITPIPLFDTSFGERFSTHNTFLEILLRFGIVGALGFIAVFLKLLRAFLNRDMLLMLALFLALSFNSFIIANTTSLPFWIFLIFFLWVCDYKPSDGEKIWDII